MTHPLPSCKGLLVGYEIGSKFDATYLRSESHAAADDEPTVGDARGHHAELALLDELNKVLNLVLECGVLVVLLSVWVGILAASVCVAE